MKMDRVGQGNAKITYFRLDDILGEECVIVEALTSDSDVREHVTEQGNMYLCLGVRNALGQEKDAHLTQACFKEIVKAMASHSEWLGTAITIYRSGSSYTTKYRIVVGGQTTLATEYIPPIQEEYIAPQEDAGEAEEAEVEPPRPQPAPVAKGKRGKVTPGDQILSNLRQAPAGLEDRAFWALVSSGFKNLSDGIKYVENAKNRGTILNDHGIWRAT
jgi:hypothetical protein